MSAPRVFMMGKFEAQIPADRHFAKNHMWALSQGGPYRFGFSAYAVRLLQDVYFLEWNLEPGVQVAERQEIGFIESSKAESALYAPVAGRLVGFNEELLSDPSAINVDGYGAGWLFELEAAGNGLLDVDAYLAHLADAWKVAERTIKGQVNQQD